MLVLTLAACGEAPQGAPPEPAEAFAPLRNVILIVVDTLRADAILDPEGRYDTPNLDRLGREGVLFTRAFAAAPMTLPSHVSLFSSRPPHETAVLNNGQSVPADLPLLAEWLGSHGYDARAVVSLGTLIAPEPGTGARRGFQSFEYDQRLIAPAERTAALLAQSLAARASGKPLFLFAHFADPHEPYDAHGTEDNRVELALDDAPLVELSASETRPWSTTLELPAGRSLFHLTSMRTPRRLFRVRQFRVLEGGEPLELRWEEGAFMRRKRKVAIAVERGDRPPAPCTLDVWVDELPANHEVRRRRYALEVAYVDRYVGELLGELERAGLLADSVIAFTSDHGESLGERKVWGHVDGLTDEMIHVPLIVRLPVGDPRRDLLARSADALVTHLDLVPTLLALVGAPPLPGQRGASLLEPHASVHVSETHTPEARRTQVALRDERFDMIFFPQEDRFELYDLVQDPLELVDVYAERGRERPEWPERLRTIAAQGSTFSEGRDLVPLNATNQELLRALGYAGADEGQGGEEESKQESKEED